MEIYIVRHTTPDIEKGICYGQADLDLARTFPKEANAILKEVPGYENFKVVSSPLKRCSLLAKRFNDVIVIDDRLKELDFGDWELQKWDDIPEKDINPWMQDFVNVAVPNGESYVDLASRTNEFFEELKHSNDTNNLILVTHAGVIRAFLSNLLEIPLKKSFSLKLEYGDCFHLKKENNAFKLITPINL